MTRGLKWENIVTWDSKILKKMFPAAPNTLKKASIAR